MKATANSIRRDLMELDAEQNSGWYMPVDSSRIESLRHHPNQAEKEENRVSAVLVTYNRAKHLPRTLESLLAQSWQNFELLICDDCSTDETQAVCQEYRRKPPATIRYFRNERNFGCRAI